MKYEDGKFLRIICTHGNEKSVACYEVVPSEKDGKSYLKPYSSGSFPSVGHMRQMANAQYLSYVSVEDIDNINLLKNKMFEVYKKNVGNDCLDWRNDDVHIDVKDITKAVLKEKKEMERKEEDIKVKAEKERSKGDGLIKNIPEDVMNVFYENNKKNLSAEEYTENIFLLTKKLFSIPESKRRVNNIEKEVLDELFSDYTIANSQEGDIRDVFNSYVNDKNKSENLKIIGNLYKKTLDKNFKGLEIKLEPNVDYELAKTIEAIEKNKYPIMLPKDNVDYIINPDTNAIYRGNNQMALQRNNNMEDIDAKAYVSMNSFIKNGGTFSNKVQRCTQIINKGKNANGNYVYEIVIPCRVSKAQIRNEKRAERSERKEEKRRNIYDSRFNYKYGHLPVFNTKLQVVPDNQPALIDKKLIKTVDNDISIDSSIESRIIADTTNYFVSMLTKEKYEPYTPWSKPEWKQALKNFVEKNPDKMIKIANLQYQDVASQVRERERGMENSHTVVREKDYEKSRGR